MLYSPDPVPHLLGSAIQDPHDLGTIFGGELSRYQTTRLPDGRSLLSGSMLQPWPLVTAHHDVRHETPLEEPSPANNDVVVPVALPLS